MAPANRIKPLGILGSVWAKEGIREMVGWATSDPIEYDGFDQGFNGVYSGNIYLQGPDETTIYHLTISAGSLTWQSLTE